MSYVRVLTDEQVAECCDMAAAIEAMKAAFSAISSGSANVPIRTNLKVADRTESLIMPVAIQSQRFFGLKAVSLTSDNANRNLPRIHAAILLFDSSTGQPAGLLNGEFITALRTGAASGLATQLMAPDSCDRLVIFGCGKQAKFQIIATTHVRQFQSISIVGRDREKAQILCDELSSLVECRWHATTDTSVIAKADVICTATPSTQPLFNAADLPTKCHVNAIGSYRPDMVEIPYELMPTFSVFVDQKDACLKEAGEIRQAIENGVLDNDSKIRELGEIIEEPFHRPDRTFFKSVGNAVQDLVVANLVMQKAEERGIGEIISL